MGGWITDQHRGNHQIIGHHQQSGGAPAQSLVNETNCPVSFYFFLTLFTWAWVSSRAFGISYAELRRMFCLIDCLGTRGGWRMEDHGHLVVGMGMGAARWRRRLNNTPSLRHDRQPAGGFVGVGRRVMTDGGGVTPCRWEAWGGIGCGDMSEMVWRVDDLSLFFWRRLERRELRSTSR